MSPLAIVLSCCRWPTARLLIKLVIVFLNVLVRLAVIDGGLCNLNTGLKTFLFVFLRGTG